MPHWRAALRSVVRRPLFTLTAVAVLAFGIGANCLSFDSLRDCAGRHAGVFVRLRVARCRGPGWRAARIDPMQALRSE